MHETPRRYHSITSRILTIRDGYLQGGQGKPELDETIASSWWSILQSSHQAILKACNMEKNEIAKMPELKVIE